jgi:organic radical activating enzyme
MNTLDIVEIFESLQGEGYWSGVPMTFVRLAGCNAREQGLGCVRWCDTPQSWDRDVGEVLSVEEVASRLRLPRVCITGGEPLLQIDGVAALVREAHARGVRVHLETNGTVGSAAEFDWVVVSPKPPRYFIAPGWAGRVDELKLIVDDELDEAAAQRLAAEFPGAIVCLQPCLQLGTGEGLHDPHSRASAEKALAFVMANPQWRLSLQMHKVLGVR